MSTERLYFTCKQPTCNTENLIINDIYKNNILKKIYSNTNNNFLVDVTSPNLMYKIVLLLDLGLEPDIVEYFLLSIEIDDIYKKLATLLKTKYKTIELLCKIWDEHNTYKLAHNIPKDKIKKSNI